MSKEEEYDYFKECIKGGWYTTITVEEGYYFENIWDEKNI